MPPIPGRKYDQLGLRIKVRKIKIGELATLLKRLESSPKHIVQVTELEIKTRWKHHEELDVELVVSTFQRAKPKDPKKSKRSKRKRGKG